MLAAQKVTKAFNAAVGAYTECLAVAVNGQLADPSLSAVQRKALDDEWTTLRESALAEAGRVVRTFNEQLRVFLGQPDSGDGSAAGGEYKPPAIGRQGWVRRSLMHAFSHCHVRDGDIPQGQSQVEVRVAVAADGSVTGIHVPAGTPLKVECVARYVVSNLHLTPATRGGQPVAAEVNIPIAIAIGH